MAGAEEKTMALVSATPASFGIDMCAYSALILAALMIGHHFSASAFWNALSASGVCWSRGGISGPSSASRVRTCGEASASTIDALSFAMIGFGVSFGTQSPYQSDA